MTMSKNLRSLFRVGELDEARQFIKGSPLVSITGATTLTEDLHAGRTMVLSSATGATVTLPTPTGSGNVYRFVVGTTVTSNDYGIDAAVATQLFKGNALVAQDAANTVVGFEAGAADHLFNMNGTTTGGILGDVVEFQDISATHWQVKAVLSATGTEATPFAT